MAAIQFSGLASGIDSGALIDSVIKARDIRNEIRRQEIDQVTSENDALETFNEKLLALNTLIDQFRSTNSGGVKKKASSSESSIVSAIAGSNASNSSATINVTSLANTASASFDQTYSSASAKVSTSGSGVLQIKVGDPGDPTATINVNITANSTTAEGLVNAINDASGADGNIVASLVNVGTTDSPSYKIMLNTLKQGEDEGSLTITAAPAITELQNKTLSQATNAVFSVSGISGTIERSSNSVSDVISGVTLNLAAQGSATISVGNDATSTSEAMKEIVTAYNDIVAFIAENNSITRVENGDNAKNVYGSLAETRLDDEFLGTFRSNLVEANSANGTTVTAFSEMGLSTNRDGTLSFDEEKFKEAIGSDATGVGEVLQSFADSVSGVGGSIYEYTKFNGAIDVAQKSNRSIVDNLNDAIDQLDRSNDKLRERLEGQFARLESITGQMQGQGNALNSVIASLNAN